MDVEAAVSERERVGHMVWVMGGLVGTSHLFDTCSIGPAHTALECAATIDVERRKRRYAVGSRSILVNQRQTKRHGRDVTASAEQPTIPTTILANSFA